MNESVQVAAEGPRHATALESPAVGFIWRYNSGTPYSDVTANADLSDFQIERATPYLTSGGAPVFGSNGRVVPVFDPNTMLVYNTDSTRRSTRSSPSAAGEAAVFGGDAGRIRWPSTSCRPGHVGHLREVLNMLNNQKQVGFDTTLEPNWDGPVDALGIPTTFTKGSRYGQATAETDYPAWRSGLTGGRAYLVALGLRF